MMFYAHKMALIMDDRGPSGLRLVEFLNKTWRVSVTRGAAGLYNSRRYEMLRRYIGGL